MVYMITELDITLRFHTLITALQWHFDLIKALRHYSPKFKVKYV